MSQAIAEGGGVKLPKVRRGSRQTRYLAQSVILEEAGSSGLIRVAMLTIALVVLGFLAWAAITDVDEVAVTTGEVLPVGKLQNIQHLEGGVISEILVKDGEVVESGQVLVRLDQAAADAELQQMKARRASLALQAERLRAQAQNRAPDFSRVPAQYAGLVEDQMEIYNTSVAAQEDRRKVLRDQIVQKETEAGLFVEQIATLRNHIALLEEEQKMRKTLFEQGLSSKVLLLNVQRELNRAKGDIQNAAGERETALKALDEVESRLAELDSNAREQALNEMGIVTAELAQVKETFEKLNDRVRRTEITAPVRGVVKGLSATTVGGVVAPGGLVAELVPMDQDLIVEARITTRDVGHLSVGQPVTVKVMTYDYARYGGITGELKEISASTFVDEQGDPYYKGIVSLDRNYVGFDPESNLVQPGMTVQADVATGKKTLLQYLLKPVYSSVNSAFIER